MGKKVIKKNYIGDPNDPNFVMPPDSIACRISSRKTG